MVLQLSVTALDGVRMARAGQQMVRDDEGGLADRISVGVLAKAFPRELVESVIDAVGAGLR